MKKRVFAAATAAMMTVSALGSVTVGAFEQTSYAEDVSVYVNGQKIDNGQYKPIIANDRTLVRLVPIFEALGYSNSYDSNAKTVTFAKDGGTVSYKFTAENYTAETISDGQAESTYELDVPATLQYSDVFYVPLRAFCDMVGLNITWDNATRSVYVESALLTYEQAKEKATEFVNDSDILLGGDTAMVEHNGRQAYAFVLRSKELVENGGSGTMGTTIYVYADNGEVDGIKGNATGNVNSNISEETNESQTYVCLGMIVEKGILKEYLNGDISESEVEAAPNNEINTTTENGLTISKALEIINVAYEDKVSGSAHVYSDYVEIGKTEQLKSDNGYNCYRVKYLPNGSTWAQTEKNVPCYEVYACSDKNFSDTNTSGRVVDMNNNIIGVAN